MLGNYTKNNESSGNSSSSSKPSSSGTAALAEVKEGAERLARELDEYLNKSSNNGNKKNIFGKNGPSSTSGEAVADLQLATARKLREVCCFVGRALCTFRFRPSLVGVFPASLTLLFYAVASNKPRFVVYGAGEKLDPVIVKLAKSARSTSGSGGGVTGVDEYRRVVCTAVVLSTHTGAVQCGSGRCSGGSSSSSERILRE